MKTQHVLIGILVSALLHFVVVMALLYQNKNTGSLAAGESGLLVSVGIAGSFSEQAKQNDEASDSEIPELVEQEKPAEPEPEPKPEQEPVPEPIVEPEPTPEPEPAPVPIAKPEKQPEPKPKPKVTPKPKPKKKPKPKPKPEPTPEPKPQAETKPAKTEATEKTGSKSKTQAMATRATGSGDRVETGGNAGARADYFAVVMARIARKKKYPRSARRDGVIGTVEVRFIIQPNGKVKQAEVVKSSGDSRLDKEALAMLKRASPLPAIPSVLGDEALTLTLPIEFSLKANRRLF